MDPLLIQLLHETIAKMDEAGSGDPSFPIPWPTGLLLEWLLDECFWASLSFDEGRLCRFRVHFYGQTPQFDDSLSVAFPAIPPIPLDRKALIQLAAISDRGALAIAVTEESGALFICGLIHQQTLMIGERRLPFEIIVGGPARLEFRFGVSRLCAWDRGRETQTMNSPFVQPGPIKVSLDSLSKRSLMGAREFRARFQGVLEEIHDEGHGGIVLLSSRKPKGVASTSFPIGGKWVWTRERLRARKARTDSFNKLRISIAEAVEEETNQQTVDDQAVAVLTSLCSIDGALWVDCNLSPRAFGLFAKSRTNIRVELFKSANVPEGEALEFRTLGARHRAAASLAASNACALVCAVSTDGGFTFFLRETGGKHVNAWRVSKHDLDLRRFDDPPLHAPLEEVIKSLVQEAA